MAAPLDVLVEPKLERELSVRLRTHATREDHEARSATRRSRWQSVRVHWVPDTTAWSRTPRGRASLCRRARVALTATLVTLRGHLTIAPAGACSECTTGPSTSSFTHEASVKATHGELQRDTGRLHPPAHLHTSTLGLYPGVRALRAQAAECGYKPRARERERCWLTLSCRRSLRREGTW